MAKGDKHEGIQVCDLKISIIEMTKHYEVHFLFDNPTNIDNRMDTAINYLGTEGFFGKDILSSGQKLAQRWNPAGFVDDE